MLVSYHPQSQPSVRPSYSFPASVLRVYCECSVRPFTYRYLLQHVLYLQPSSTARSQDPRRGHRPRPDRASALNTESVPRFTHTSLYIMQRSIKFNIQDRSCGGAGPWRGRRCMCRCAAAARCLHAALSEKRHRPGISFLLCQQPVDQVNLSAGGPKALIPAKILQCGIRHLQQFPLVGAERGAGKELGIRGLGPRERLEACPVRPRHDVLVSLVQNKDLRRRKGAQLVVCQIERDDGADDSDEGAVSCARAARGARSEGDEWGEVAPVRAHHRRPQPTPRPSQ